MKVLVFVKATPNSEQGLPPTEDMQKMFAEMGAFNEKLVKAGVMVEGDGLKPSSAGKRIKFSSGAVTVVDGPFAETKELVAGYWVWNVKSVEEAVSWARQCPNPMPGEEGILEIRPTYTADDFGEMLTDEERAREARLRKEVERQQARGAKVKTGKPEKSAARKPARAKAKFKAKAKPRSKPRAKPRAKK